jgi:hypothetical protein
MYVITSKADQGQNYGEVVYYALDGPSGGYPYWSHFLGNAKFFDTVEEAVDRMRKELLHAKTETMTSSKSYPATLVHSALGLNNIVKKRNQYSMCCQN